MPARGVPVERISGVDSRHRLSVAVDLHCHLLPGVDDGARDRDDAVAMAQQAQRDGIVAVCATPHIRHDHDVRIGELADRVAEVSAAIAAAGCRTRVLTGGEVAASAVDRLDDDDLARVSLGGSGRWILLEPDRGPIGDSLQTAVDELGARGFRAVVAHPERHLASDLVQRLLRVVAKGALIQATAASFLDPGARPGMLGLARAGVIHVLGSDSHSSRAGRPVALSAALDVLATALAADAQLRWIARTAPQAIVSGAELRPPFAAVR